MAAFPSPCAPQEVQTGSSVVWRPPRSGDQEGDGRPGYPRKSTRPSVRERAVCVGTCDSGLEEGAANRRCVTPSLRTGLHVSCWASVPPSCLLLELSRTLTSEKRRLRPRSSRRLQNLSTTSSFSSLRAALVSALPCSDRYAAGWRSPQTQRRYSCGSPYQRFCGNSQ